MILRTFYCAVLLFFLGVGSQFTWAKPNRVLVLNVNGVINTGVARYVDRGVETAAKTDAALVVIVLNTPGGLLSSTREIVQTMNKSQVPVAVYVSPSGASATSAGTIITMASHFAAMAPGTNIGAAHPVGGQGEDVKGAMADKAVNDTVAFIKSQAALRDRNADWAEQAIRKSVSVTADEAVKLKVVDFLASDLKEVIFKIEGQAVLPISKEPKLVHAVGLPFVELAMTWAERFLTFIGDPNISYMLLTLGGLCIYVEITSPGAIIPGILGAISLILAFISFATLPVSSGGVALLVLGLILFGLEAFVTSYGALTIGGIASIILGALFLMDPSTGDLRLSLMLVLPSVLAVALITTFIGYKILRSRKTVYAGLDNFDGFVATVQSVDSTGRQGKCLVRGEVWDFELSDSEKEVHLGDHLKVIQRNGLKLFVKVF